jgi:hypothetical protein
MRFIFFTLLCAIGAFVAINIVRCQHAEQEPTMPDLRPPVSTALNVSVSKWSVQALYPGVRDVVLSYRDQQLTICDADGTCSRYDARVFEVERGVYRAEVDASWCEVDALSGDMRLFWHGKLETFTGVPREREGTYTRK